MRPWIFTALLAGLLFIPQPAHAGITWGQVVVFLESLFGGHKKSSSSPKPEPPPAPEAPSQSYAPPPAPAPAPAPAPPPPAVAQAQSAQATKAQADQSLAVARSEQEEAREDVAEAQAIAKAQQTPPPPDRNAIHAAKEKAAREEAAAAKEQAQKDAPQFEKGPATEGFKGVLFGNNSDPDAAAKAAAAAAAVKAEDDKFLANKIDKFAAPASAAASNPQLRAGELSKSARSMLAMGDRAEAIKEASAALKLAPTSPSALATRSTALNLSGRHDEASNDARLGLGTLSLRAGAANGADEASGPLGSVAVVGRLGAGRDQEDGSSDQSDELALRENLAWANLRKGDYNEAVKEADQAIKLDPKSAKAYATRAFAKQMLGDMAGLKADLNIAAELDARYEERAALARAGKLAYDPNGDDASYLLDSAAALSKGVKSGGAWPLAAGGFGGLAALAALIGYLAVRRRDDESRPEPAEPARPAVKALLAGKYRMEGIIGRGGMGEVRRAKDMTLGRPVAIKTLVLALAKEGPEGEEARERLRKEAKTVAAIHHPGIVDIYEIVEEDGALHLVFEYLEGITVHSMIAQKGRITAVECARLLAPVCDALSFSHSQGLVHRDLKPANIMLTSTNHVKLMDFGIARAQGELVAVGASAGASGLRFDRTTTVAGTPVYMAPEVEEGLVGTACDVYSLGVCLYEMLTARRPYPDAATSAEKAKLQVVPASKLVSGVPPAVDALVAAAMSIDPAGRPASVEAFKTALNAAV